MITMYPDLLNVLVKSHQDQLLAEADRFRLLKIAKRRNRSMKSEGRKKSPGVSARAGTLATCGPHVAGSAR
jgi:hypothetical protein